MKRETFRLCGEPGKLGKAVWVPHAQTQTGKVT
jgi:hypothetical protein